MVESGVIEFLIVYLLAVTTLLMVNIVSHAAGGIVHTVMRSRSRHTRRT